MGRKGLLVVVSAPSGAGKSTICAKVLKLFDNAVYSVSATTRKPRMGEVHGRNYFFLSVPEFKKLIKQKKLLEWAKVHGHYYGTPKKFIRDNIAKGKIVILDIDVQGAMKIKRARIPNSVFIFIKTPTFEILKRRLINRGSDDKETIAVRLNNARHELKYCDRYDYLVINDKVNAAAQKIKSIIIAETLKIPKKT